MAKKFLYVAMGILAVSIAYNLAASRLQADTGAEFVALVQVDGATAISGVYALDKDGNLFRYARIGSHRFRSLGNYRTDSEPLTE